MVDGIQGRSGPLAREAILAALKAQAQSSSDVRSKFAEVAELATRATTSHSSAQATDRVQATPDLAGALLEGIGNVDNQVQSAEALPAELLTGGIGDISEVAARLKTAELTFRFSMEIRNKLIDAYREVMRMQV